MIFNSFPDKKKHIMNMCRTCLETPADKHISELGKNIKGGHKDNFEIMKFCLDIEVTQDSKITTNLCSKCYRKILSFYNFKELAQKSNLYLKSLDPEVRLKDQKLSVYVDENGIKHENFLDSDECGPILVQDRNTDIKVEFAVEKDESLGDLEADVKHEDLQGVESDDELLCDVQKFKHEHISNVTKKIAPVRKKRGRPKRVTLEKQECQVCEECGKSVRDIKQHSLSHRPQEDRRMLKCKACPKLFVSVGGRSRHYKYIHLGRKPKCDICNKEVRCLKVHKMQVHNPDELPFGCVLCGRRFITQFSLDVHVAQHTKDLKYECDLCQKKFLLKNMVLRHIRKIHEKERNYQCELCDKAFFDKKSLEKHSGTHSKERLFKCEECGLALKSRETLRIHRRTHTDIKNYHCQLCSKSFKTSSNLKLHMVTHTKEKRFDCRFCGVRFGRSHHRSRHEFTAHQKHLQAE